MATEALIAPGLLDGTTPMPPQPQIREVPIYLWKSTLVARRNAGEIIPESLWTDRAFRVEEYVQSVLATETDIIAGVETDNEDRDSKGPDLHIHLVEGFPTDDFPIDDLLVEVKSSPETIEAYKQKIRDSLPEGERDQEHVIKYFVKHRIILINGGVGRSGIEKTPEKIKYKSFYPQLFRIIEAGREEDGDEVIYGNFYPQVTAIKRKILEVQKQNNPTKVSPESPNQMTLLFQQSEKTPEPPNQMTLNLSESGQIIEAPGQIQIFPELA